MTSISIRRTLAVVPFLVLAACAQAAATPRAAESPSDRQTSQEASGPESTLRKAYVAAGVVFDDDSKSFDGATLDMFATVDPDSCYVSDSGRAGACDPGGDTVFVAWNDQAFGAATSDGAGGCLYIRNDGTDHANFGSGSECSGAAALKASSDVPWGERPIGT